MSSYSALEHAGRLKESLFRKGLHTLVFQPVGAQGLTPDDLSRDEVSQLCDTLGRFPSLVLEGREPFLRPDLYRLCRTFLLACGVERLAVLTEGSKPEETAAFVQDLLFAHPGLGLSIKVSLDGDQALHDRLKSRPGAFNDAFVALDKLKSLKARCPGLSVVVRTMISKENEGALPDLMGYVFDKVRPDRHEFDLCLPEDGAPGLPDSGSLKRLHRQVLENKSRYLVRDGATRLRRVGTLVLAAGAQDLQRGRLGGPGLCLACSGGRNICIIGPDGSLRFCPCRAPVGGLRSTGMDFRKLWRSDKAGAERREHEAGGCSCPETAFLQASASAGVLPALRLLLRLPWAIDNLP
ncbi:MAG: hypothetical protein WC943_05495 [Elusimicrobiota bacterium]|jgi:MoaA/NifB/PqqE/SkfB family radical SAM enzyme